MSPRCLFNQAWCVSVLKPPGFAAAIVCADSTSALTEVHYYAHGRNGAFDVRQPIVLGHESGGTIVEIGPDCFGDLKVGNVRGK